MVRIFKKSDLEVAAGVLCRGGLVAFPTETVYGLGGNAYDDAVVAKIFQCKQRPSLNPVSVCYADFSQAKEDVEITELAQVLADRFMPGGITLILKRKDSSRVSLLCSAGGNTLGIRVPDNGIAINLLNRLDFPLAAPSANMSQEMSATSASDVASGLKSNKDLAIIDGGTCRVGIESTIVDLTRDVPTITRLGAVSVGELSRASGVNFSVEQKQSVKHYQTTKKIVRDVSIAGQNDAFLGFGDVCCFQCKYFDNLSEIGDVAEAAKNFFSMVHKMDATDADKICIAPIPKCGIGLAINSKLEQMADVK